MKLLAKTILILSLLGLMPVQAYALTTTKTQLGYITEIRGLKKVYRPGDTLRITVRAKQADGRGAFDETGWQVGAQTPDGRNDPQAPYTGATITPTYRRGMWTFTYPVGSTSDTFDMNINLHCGSASSLCGHYTEYKDEYYMYYISFRVARKDESINTTEIRPRTVRYTFKRRTLHVRSQDAIYKEDGLTEEELEKLLEQQKEPTPKLNKAWFTVDCSQDPNGTPESQCTSHRLWLDPRTADGKGAVVYSPSFTSTNFDLRLYLWAPLYHIFNEPSSLYFAEEDGQWYATMVYGEFHDVTFEYLVEIEEKGNSGWFWLTLAFDHSGGATATVKPMKAGWKEQ